MERFNLPTNVIIWYIWSSCLSPVTACLNTNLCISPTPRGSMTANSHSLMYVNNTSTKSSNSINLKKKIMRAIVLVDLYFPHTFVSFSTYLNSNKTVFVNACTVLKTQGSPSTMTLIQNVLSSRDFRSKQGLNSKRDNDIYITYINTRKIYGSN